jgi:hypothetical protein
VRFAGLQMSILSLEGTNLLLEETNAQLFKPTDNGMESTLLLQPPPGKMGGPKVQMWKLENWKMWK